MSASSRKIDDKLLLQKHAEGLSGLQLSELFGCSPAAISKRLKRLAPRQPSAIDNLTPKQAAVVKRMAAGYSGTEAVSQCYDTTSRASSREIARRLLASPEVQLALEEEMARAGLDRRYRVAKLAEHCDHPDPSVALKALDMSFRLSDEYPAIKSKSMVVLAEACPVDLSQYSM